MSFSSARQAFKRAALSMQDPVEKMAANYVGSFGGGMPQMPAASVGGGMGGAKIVGGRGGGKLTGSNAGSAMVGRHQANMMVQGMQQQNDFAKSYANALGRMSRGHARIKTGSAPITPPSGMRSPGSGARWTLGAVALGAAPGAALGYMSGGKDKELSRRNALLGGAAGAGLGGLGALGFTRSHRATQAMKQDVIGELQNTGKSIGKARGGIKQDISGGVGKAKEQMAKGTHVNIGPLSVPVNIGPKTVKPPKPPKSSWKERIGNAWGKMKEKSKGSAGSDIHPQAVPAPA